MTVSNAGTAVVRIGAGPSSAAVFEFAEPSVVEAEVRVAVVHSVL